MNRAERRHRAARAKAEARRHIATKSELFADQLDNPRTIGIRARTPQLCSTCCGNLRKYEGATLQERRFACSHAIDELERAVEQTRESSNG